MEDAYQKKSDADLIECMSILDPSKREYIKAILDKRMRDSLQYLTGVIQKNNIDTEKYNNTLARLTKWILLLTAVMTFATIINILIIKKII